MAENAPSEQSGQPTIVSQDDQSPAPETFSTPETTEAVNGSAQANSETNAESNGHVTANGSAAATLQQAKETVVTSKVITSVQNNQTVKDLANGPAVQTVKEEASKTSSEFQTLANARTTPSTPAVTGQPLTHYHSFFYRLLSWENPRATAATFVANIIFILSARYLNVLKYALKGTYFVLGVTSVIEIIGKLAFEDGLASKMRPKKYWKIPRESLERGLDDVEQLLNFFVIECQRIIWAENIAATISVFSAALVSYWLIKLVPFWGLALIGTCVIYLTPLVYIQNRQAIDEGIEEVSNVISSQATQLRNITAEQTEKTSESLKSYTNELTQKAQELMGSNKTSDITESKLTDLPSAPTHEPHPTSEGTQPTATESEPLLS